jgi:uncharacterized protein
VERLKEEHYISGTRGGGLKVAEKMKAKNPNFYRDIGVIGGRNGTGHDFAHGKADPRISGAKGGKISRRKNVQKKY